MQFNQQIGARIKQIRESKQIKQTTLAHQLAMSVQTLSAIENGKCEITIGKLQQLSNALSISVVEIIGSSTYNDPLAERKQLLEETTIRLLNMYNDLLQNQKHELEIARQNAIIIHLQKEIIHLLAKRIKD